MEFAIRNKERITRMYDDGMSSYQIAEELGTYSAKILRALKYLGVERRNYKEAQKAAIDGGRSAHPTKGKKLSDDHKGKIGRKRSEQYKALSAEEKKRISETSKASWDALGKAKQAEIRALAHEAVRVSSRIGSKTERHIKNGLEKEGYEVIPQKENLVRDKRLTVDLYLPAMRLVIEIDGPSHFQHIWDPDGSKGKLSKQQKADLEKQGSLLGEGYVVIRIRQLDKNLSLVRMEAILEAIIKELKEVERVRPTGGKRLIEIEVKDGETKRI